MISPKGGVKMSTNNIGDCYICSIDNLDSICETLIKKGCIIKNVVPTDFYINGASILATRMCITYERPNNISTEDVEKNLDN